MPYYGDIAGDFRNLLKDSCEVVVAAVVGGPHHDCYRCPKRAVRNVTRLDEARWYDMQATEKRRFMDCFDENAPPLEFGYAVFEKSDFTTMDSHYKLFQDVSFPPVWDIAIRGLAYVELLRQLSIADGEAFYADQFQSVTQTDELCNVIGDYLPGADVECVSSTQTDGVQAADCFAGAVAEQEKGGEPWLDYLDCPAQVNDCSHWTLMEIEHWLTE